MSLFRLVTTAFLLALGSAGAADVTGKWSLSIDSGAAHSNTELDLKQEGSKLSGTYKGSGSESPLKGSVKGDAIEFTVAVGNRKMIFKGSASGSSMSGTMEMAGLDEGGRWQAHKK